MESSIDREKVIKGLDHCANEADCRGCVYQEQMKGRSDGCDCMMEALAMLKEQEAVEARKKNDGKPQPWTSWWYVCGNCGQEIEYHDRFCRWCGKAVKWK